MPIQARPTGDHSVDVAIVFALDLEAAPLVRRLKGRARTTAHRFVLERGLLGDARVLVIRTGTGPGRLAAALDALLPVHRPRWLVAAGFATGLSDRLHAGEIVLASELVSEQLERLTVDLRPSADQPGSPGVHIAPVVSTGDWPRQSADKRRLGEQSGACAADLQSFTVARLCADRGLKFLAVRVVIDEVSRDAGPESLAVYNPSRSYRAGAAVGALLNSPGRAGRVWRLRSAAKEHAARLATVLADIIPRLP